MGYEDPLMYLPHKPVQTFVRGQSIYDSQRPASHLYLDIRGRVKIIHTAEDGCQIIARIVRAEGLFGESCLVSSQPAGEAVALDNVTLMAWTPTEIEQQVEREPRLGLALTQYIVRMCIELLDRIESMAAYNTPQRVMLALAQLATELGTKMPDGTVRLQSLTHHTIAEYVGTSREIVTFEMNRLRRLGMLSYNRKHIDVYLDAIEDNLRQHGITLPYAITGCVVPPANGSLDRQPPRGEYARAPS
jgi:CRP/FNR family cyclic AMP-dependent transcriptional regulator